MEALLGIFVVVLIFALLYSAMSGSIDGRNAGPRSAARTSSSQAPIAWLSFLSSFGGDSSTPHASSGGCDSSGNSSGGDCSGGVSDGSCSDSGGCLGGDGGF